MSKTRTNITVTSTMRKMRTPKKKIAELVRFVARKEGVRLGEIDIAVVGRKKIASLNRQYLGRDEATDVISFDLAEHEGGVVDGQIVICGDLARRRAEQMKIPTLNELMLYVIHGLLHIIGYDDRSATDAEKMHARQEKLLESFQA